MTTTTLSIEEFYNLPDVDACKRELIEGDLIELPPPKAQHTFIAARLLYTLRDYLTSRGQQSANLCPEPGFEIPARRRSWLRPDIALLHPGQLINDAGYLEGAPLLAIEVLSPTNKASDIDRKRQIYLENGSQEVWIVYPETRTVTIETSQGQLTHHCDTIVSALLPGFLLKLDELFQHP